MKYWNQPAAVCQQFAANEYVSACYKVRCITPNGNAAYRYLAADTNHSGAFDEGDDIIFNPQKFNQRYVAGCSGTHVIQITGNPSDIQANGFAVNLDKPFQECQHPIYFWYGDVIDVSKPGYHVNETAYTDVHCTDLSAANAFVHDGANMS